MRRLALVAALLAASVLGTVLLPAGHVSAAPSLQLSRSSVAPGDTITVQGFGFTPGDDVVVGVTVTNGGHAQRITNSASADGNGNFSTTLTIPHGAAQGTVTVDARDFHAHVASQRLTIYPLAYVVPNGKVYTVYVIPGHAFFISGAGFQPSETINLSASFPLYDGNTTTYSHTAQADSHGNFSEVFVRVPQVPDGAAPRRLSRRELTCAARAASDRRIPLLLFRKLQPGVHLTAGTGHRLALNLPL